MQAKSIVLVALGLAFLLPAQSQEMSKAETVVYINNKLREHPKTYSRYGRFSVTTSIVVVDNRIIATEIKKNLENAEREIKTSRAYLTDFDYVYINNPSGGQIWLTNRNRSKCVDVLYDIKNYKTTQYHEHLAINIGGSDESKQYLSNAFRHLIDLSKEVQQLAASKDPFANYQSKSQQKKVSTPVKTTTAPISKTQTKSTSQSTNKPTTTLPKVYWKPYTSSKYHYTIKVLSSFTKTTATGRNIDMKFVAKDATNILVNVSPKTSDEYGQTAHDYSRQMFEDMYKQYNLNTRIVETQKTYLAGEKAFKLVYYNPNNSTKAIEYYFYKGSNAYVITTTAKSAQFSKYEGLFMESIKSIKF